MRFQKLLLCLSRKRTLVCLHKEGEDFDKEILEWRKGIEGAMQSSRVRVAIYYRICTFFYLHFYTRYSVVSQLALMILNLLKGSYCRLQW